MTRWVAVGMVLVAVVAGCHAGLARKQAQGRDAEVLSSVERSRLEPRGKAARAWANALVAQGQSERARDALLRDYRRGGKTESLVALADLEANMGLRGVAALHYARVVTVDPEVLAGRLDVCRLFRARAQGLLEIGEGLAAEQDLDRADQLCDPKSAPLADRLQHEQARQRISDVADGQVKRRIALNTRPVHNAVTDDEHPFVPRSGQSGAAEIVELILADVRGELGDGILTDDVLRFRLGALTWADLSPHVVSRPPPEASYLQLRLAFVLPQSAGLPAGGAVQVDRWSDRSIELEGAVGWRVFGLRGNLPGAELALAASWRPRRSLAPADTAPAQRGTKSAPVEPDSVVVEPPSDGLSHPGDQRDNSAAAGSLRDRSGLPPSPRHWSARLPNTEEALKAALLVSRLRHTAGQQDLALSVARYVLARAHRGGVAEASSIGAHEAIRALAAGQPWRALAIVDALDLAELKPIAAAAASSALLIRQVCGGPCWRDDDLALVTRVMGAAWITRTRASLSALALGRWDQAPKHGSPPLGCPTISELLSSEASGPLATAVQASLDQPTAPGVGDSLRVALESDVTMVCAAKYVLPLMVVAGAELNAARISEMWVYAPETTAAPALRVQTQLAMLGRQPIRAELLSVAAGAASLDPALTWGTLARFAERLDQRDTRLRALRQQLLHTVALDQPQVRQRLVVASLRDLRRGFETDVGRESIDRIVREYLARVPAGQQWARRDQLIRTVADQPWLDPKLRRALVELLFPDVQGAASNDRAWVRLADKVVCGPSEPASVECPPQTAVDIDGIALAARRRRLAEVPPATTIFADPVDVVPARLAVARYSRDWQARWRAAVGGASFGTAQQRIAAVDALMQIAREIPSGRTRIVDWLKNNPAALAPGRDVPGIGRPVVESDAALIDLIFGLRPVRVLAPVSPGR